MGLDALVTGECQRGVEPAGKLDPEETEEEGVISDV